MGDRKCAACERPAGVDDPLCCMHEDAFARSSEGFRAWDGTQPRASALADFVRRIQAEEAPRRGARWVSVELECKHGRVELESGRNERRDCRICRMLAEAA